MLVGEMKMFSFVLVETRSSMRDPKEPVALESVSILICVIHVLTTDKIYK